MADENEPEEVVEAEVEPEIVKEIDGVEDLHEDDHDHEDDLGTKVIKALGIMVLGGIVALWLGPKIAPALPSGMAPVAAWLAPGGAQNREGLAELRSEIDGRFATLPTGLTTSDVENVVSLRLSNVEGRMSARVDALSGLVRLTDGEEVEARLAELELVTAGLRAELSSLVSQFTEITLSGGEVTADTAARIATYGAALDGLKAEIEALAAQNGALSQKIDEVSIDATLQIEEAETKAVEAEAAAETSRMNSVVKANMAAISTALAAGLPFEDALLVLAENGVVVADDLTAAASGIASMSQLRADFPDAAHAMIRASIAAESGGGFGSSVGTFFRSQVASRSLTPQEGNSADAILSRAEAALKLDDLAAALQELGSLSAETTPDQMAVWIGKADQRLAAIQAFAAIPTEGSK